MLLYCSFVVNLFEIGGAVHSGYRMLALQIRYAVSNLCVRLCSAVTVEQLHELNAILALHLKESVLIQL